MKYENIYKSLNLLSGLPREKWEMLSKLFKEHQFKRSETILEVGNSSKEIHFITDGLARNFYTNEDGREYTKIFRGPNELIGPYMEVLAKIPSRYTIQTLCPTKTLSFNYEDFLVEIENDLEWQKVVRRIAEQNFLEKERREFMLLHMNLEDKYALFLKEFSHFKDEIPQYQIASYLGVTPEALNRYLKKS